MHVQTLKDAVTFASGKSANMMVEWGLNNPVPDVDDISKSMLYREQMRKAQADALDKGLREAQEIYCFSDGDRDFLFSCLHHIWNQTLDWAKS